MHPSRPEVTAEDVRSYLELTRLLEEIQLDRPDVSAPLRLSLQRARRDGQIGSIDKKRFRAVVGAANPAGKRTGLILP